jgi:hypothetical protein
MSARPSPRQGQGAPPAPALSDTLSVILPTREETSLLRACLLSGEEGRKAWQEWLKHASDPKRMLEKGGAFKGLLPLLFSAVRRNGVDADSTLLTLLRAAHMREELRSKTYRRICQDVIRTLASEALPAVLLKGAALAGTVYADGALRHSHDIDILVHDDHLSEVADALPLLGFRLLRRQLGPDGSKAELEHVSGLPVQLHSRPFSVPYANMLLAAFWDRSRVENVADVPTRVLSPADNLLHVCGHASSTGSRHSLRWVCDARHLIQGRPDLEWDVLLDSAVQSQLALPLYVMLRYLAADLRAGIPTHVLGRLAAAASQVRALGRDGALHGARLGERSSFKSLLRHSKSWRSRARLVQWMLFPSPGYVYWIDEVRYPWLMPLYYVYRPLRYSARRVAWRFGHSG